MTQIRRYKGGITIEGHAGYGEFGSDIVCAAVSVLAQNLIQSIEELTDDTIRYEILPGWVDIKFTRVSRASKLLLDSFWLGIKSISEEYPDNVQIMD